MNARQKRKLQSTAYHEAGHAVVAFLLRRRIIRKVTIVPEGDTLGHICRSVDKGFNPEWDTGLEAERKLKKEIMICFAGDVAESILRKRAPRVEKSSSDTGSVVDLALYLLGDPVEVGLYLSWIVYHTKNLLRRPAHWAAVEAVALSLLEKKELNQKEVYRTIKDAIRISIEEGVALLGLG